MTGKGQLKALRTYWRTKRPSEGHPSREKLRRIAFLEMKLAKRKT